MGAGVLFLLKQPLITHNIIAISNGNEDLRFLVSFKCVVQISKLSTLRAYQKTQHFDSGELEEKSVVSILEIAAADNFKQPFSHVS